MPTLLLIDGPLAGKIMQVRERLERYIFYSAEQPPGRQNLSTPWDPRAPQPLIKEHIYHSHWYEHGSASREAPWAASRVANRRILVGSVNQRWEGPSRLWFDRRFPDDYELHLLKHAMSRTEWKPIHTPSILDDFDDWWEWLVYRRRLDTERAKWQDECGFYEPMNAGMPFRYV